MTSGVTDEAVPCIVSEMQVKDIRNLIEAACEKAPALTWLQDRRIPLNSVSLTLRYNSTLIIEGHDDRTAESRPLRIHLHRSEVGFYNLSPLALLRSWRDSLGSAVYEGSTEAHSDVGALEQSARCLAAAAVAAGLRNAIALAWSSQTSNSTSRFQIREADRRICAPPALSRHLERKSPRFRLIEPIAGFSRQAAGTLRASATDARSIDPLEMMRLIADLPAAAVAELAASLLQA